MNALHGRQGGGDDVEDGGGKAVMGQTVTEAARASVEEADAWCVAAGDVGRATGEPFVALPTE